MMKIDRAWTSKVQEQDKESWERKLRASQKIFDREKEILDQWLEKEFADSIGDEDFGSPNWAAHQAYRKGKMRAYKEVLNLLRGLTSE